MADFDPTTTPLRRLNVYAFEQATLALLITNVNKFLNGKALTVGESGTQAYNAGEATNKVFVGWQYVAIDATHYSLMIFYAGGK